MTSARNRGFKKIVGSKGALHRQLGVPEGQPIPPGKKKAALSGRYGPVAKRRAGRAFRGVLAAGRKTVARHARRRGNSVRKETSSANLYAMAEKKIARKRARRGGG